MSLFADVLPVYTETKDDEYRMIDAAIEELKKNGTLEKGDTLVAVGTRKSEETIDLGRIINI